MPLTRQLWIAVVAIVLVVCGGALLVDETPLNLLAWFAAGTILAGLAAALLLQRVLRQLGAIGRQAEAIGMRRFITMPEPATREFRVVAHAMNALTKRVRQMLDNEAQRLEQLRREAHHDPVTGLLNRGHFMARLMTALDREDEGARGTLVIARLLDLNDLNRTHGWPVMDALIRRFARALERIGPKGADWVVGRLNGSDFAVLAPAHDAAEELARQIQEALLMVAQEFGLETSCHLPAAATIYRHGDQLGHLLRRVDAALGVALQAEEDEVQLATIDLELPDKDRPLDLDGWKQRFEQVLNTSHIKLRSYPVIGAAGQLVHNECVARLRLDMESAWLHAGEFVPWLARLGKLGRLDEMVIDMALDRLLRGADDICINLSAQAMSDPLLLHRLARRLNEVRDSAVRLWIEIPEHGVFQDLESFRLLSALLKPLGCRIGIEHVGHRVAQLGRLHDVGVDYIKVDGSFIRGIDLNQANQVFLRGFAMIAHSIGLQTLAEGVNSAGELKTLLELGFDGATGPGVTTMRSAGGISS